MELIGWLAVVLLLTVGIWFLQFLIARADRPSFAEPSPQSKRYVLKADGVSPVQPMSAPTNRKMTFRDERDLAHSHQRVWIRYEDQYGDETEREIEVYCPREDDDFIFAWCCSRQEPRTFRRKRIVAWKVLDDRFDFNPLVEQYFQEEGGRNPKDSISWKRWKELRRLV